MYKDLIKVYWWNNMKKNITRFVAVCLNYQQLVEHQRMEGLSQYIEITTWKGDMDMDFVIGLLLTHQQHSSNWVVIDRMTKLTHFLYVKTSYFVEDYIKIYTQKLLKIYRFSLSIISHCGTQFTFHFWKSIKKGLGTKVKLSTTFHPQINGQEEKTIETLKDLLRKYVLDIKDNWDDHLSLVKLACNNSYHSSIRIAHMRLCMI